MRPIDGDALKDRLQALSYDDWNQGVSTTWANAYAECADMVEDMPTIEPERKTGKWIVFSSPDEYHCGLVKCPFCSEELIAEANEYNYCPNCGCSMKGETDERN